MKGEGEGNSDMYDLFLLFQFLQKCRDAVTRAERYLHITGGGGPNTCSMCVFSTRTK